MGDGLWELRSSITDGIARVIFVAQGDLMILLHGFIKKSRKTPEKELAVARKRAAALLQGGMQ
jgi:phage-related protein